MEQLAAFWQDVKARGDGWRLSAAAVLAAFAATMFLSALLLFSVQPMFAKMALPALGGTPAVWAVSMCFFQAALLGGYIYAHSLNRWLSTRHAIIAHVSLLAVAALALPIGLPKLISDPPAGDAYMWLIGVLTLGVGLPFFTVSASAPLLQSWFSKSGHPDAHDPYFLYGASNFGSLLALIAYPIIIEPQLGLATQSALWSLGFGALAMMIASCGIIIVSARAGEATADALTGEAQSTKAAEPIDWWTRYCWIGLAAIPSGLMVAVTTYITTDIGSAPFIWVIPLAMFLVTFIVVFKENLGFNYGWALNALPAAILIHLLCAANWIGVAAGLVAFFLAAIVCHRELYLRRPSAGRLTEFYICMSAGGVMGGIFSALIAPQIFGSVIEFKLLVLASLLARPGMLEGIRSARSLARVAAVAVAMTALLIAYKKLTAGAYIADSDISLAVIVFTVLGGVFLTRTWPEHRPILVIAMIVGLAVVPSDGRTIYSERSFFGTLRVMRSDNDQHRLMLHGNTIHGAERVMTPDGRTVERAEPATYYAAGAPMPRGVAVARSVMAARGQPFTVGVVGLGTGSLTCSSMPGENWRYFEIDPMVARVARDPKLFTLLSRCMPDNDIVFGDARLTLAKEPAAKFGYLLIDAFSSDAIPVHLLTQQAIEMYANKLAPGGVLAIHISNRFLNLAPSIAATVATIPALGGIYVKWQPSAPDPDASASNVVFLAREPATLAALNAAWPDAEPLAANGAHAWTDDYSNVLEGLIANWRK